ncbi:uncharacterized protein HD556DRAFT_1230294, partial [Suillus plorans]
AHEEITHLNVEVLCLCTSMHDEELRMSAIVQDILVSDLQLAHELQCQYHSCTAINAVHCYRLDHIEKLAGFSGVRGVGICLAHDADVAHSGTFCWSTWIQY